MVTKLIADQFFSFHWNVDIKKSPPKSTLKFAVAGDVGDTMSVAEESKGHGGHH